MASERPCWHLHCIRSARLPRFARGTHSSRPSRSAADAFDRGRHAKSPAPSSGPRPRRTMPSASHRRTGQAAVAKALSRSLTGPIAFSSEADTGSHSNQVYADCVDLSAVENASKQEARESVLIQSEPIAPDDTSAAQPKTKKITRPAPHGSARSPVKKLSRAGVIQGDQSMRVWSQPGATKVHIARNARSRSLAPIFACPVRGNLGNAVVRFRPFNPL